MVFSASDEISITFDQFTNRPDVSNNAAVTQFLQFSSALSAAANYTAVWTTAKLLTLTIVSVTGSKYAKRVYTTISRLVVFEYFYVVCFGVFAVHLSLVYGPSLRLGD